MPKLKKKRSSTISIDFSGVESGGGRAVPDGNYTLKVKEVTEEESRDGNPYLKWVYVVTTGSAKGALVYDNTSLQSQSLWRLKSLLECLGVEVPDSAMDFDPSDVVDSELDAEITNETFEGKQKPRLTAFLGEGGSAPAATTSKKKASKKVEEEEEESEEEEEEEETPKKVASKKSKVKVGQKVRFKDDDGKSHRGTITAIDGDEATVDVKGEEWSLDSAELEAA